MIPKLLKMIFKLFNSISFIDLFKLLNKNGGIFQIE